MYYVCNHACVSFAEHQRQTGVSGRQGIAGRYRRFGDRHFHHSPVVDRVLLVLLSAPAQFNIGRHQSTEKIAHQRVFQRWRSEQQSSSSSRHVTGVRAVRTAKELVGRRQPGTKATPTIRIVADWHWNERAQKEFTGRDVHERLVVLSSSLLIHNLGKSYFCHSRTACFVSERLYSFPASSRGGITSFSP